MLRVANHHVVGTRSIPAKGFLEPQDSRADFLEHAIVEEPRQILAQNPSGAAENETAEHTLNVAQTLERLEYG